MEKVATYVRVSRHNNADNAVRDQAKRIEDFCETHGYDVCDSAFVVGDRKQAYPMFKGLLGSAKEKGINRIVMASSNRIVGSLEEVKEIQAAIEASGVTIETLDGSYENGINTNGLVASFLAFTELESHDEFVDEDEG